MLTSVVCRAAALVPCKMQLVNVYGSVLEVFGLAIKNEVVQIAPIVHCQLAGWHGEA